MSIPSHGGHIMQWSRRAFRFAILAILVVAFAVQPASARRTVYDTWGEFGLGGYCSPDTVEPPDCAPYAMPFSIEIDGTTYDSFYVNSNGTLSFGSIASFLARENSYSGNSYTGPPPQTSLSAYGVPIFSPNFADGPGYLNDFGFTGYDGNFYPIVSIGRDTVTVRWSQCDGYPLSCGLFSYNLVASATYNPADLGAGGDDLQGIIMANGCFPCTPEQQFASGQQAMENWIMNHEPIYTMTLTVLANGFRVDYSYNAAATGKTGVYGFNLPSGLEQTRGPLENRSYVFNPVGHLTHRGTNANGDEQ